MTENKTILVICYSYPPNKGIGGRRWAKFSKHLAENGYSIEIICKKAMPGEKSQWTQDTLHSNINLNTLPSLYPTILGSVPETFLEKLGYRIWLFAFLILSKGTFPERTFFWKNQLLKKASEIIQKKKIKNIVVTVPPFRLGYYASFLKKKNPDLNFILDYRDPWTDNKTFHGFLNLSAKRRNFEWQMEKTALNRADSIITANQQMSDWLKEKLDPKANVITIPNGYDPADLQTKAISEVKNNNSVRCIYAGTFYSNVEYILTPFLNYLKQQEENDPEFSRKFLFEFYGDMDPKMKALFLSKNLQCLRLNKPIALHEIHYEIQKSDCCLIFAAQDHSFAFNTKFYEYLANKKPIAIFSKTGEVPDFLKSNHLGFHINLDHFEEDFNDFIKKLLDRTFEFNKNYDASHFSTNSHTKILETLFI